MIITITANLTDEETLVLAKEQWWTESITINQTINTDWSMTNWDIIPNPISAWETLREVYKSIVIENATVNFIKYNQRTYWPDIDFAWIKQQVINNIVATKT